MAAVSTDIVDSVAAILSRDVAETKSRGNSNPDVEAAALFESITLNLLLFPRSALYICLLARNSLLAVINAEIDAIATLLSDVQDSANPSYQLDGSDVLQRARTALLQLEAVSQVSTSSPLYSRFDSAITEYLNNHLSKNVKRRGSTSLIRPAAEALQAMPDDLAELKTLHTDLLDRLYALVVAMDNFLLAPLSTFLGLTTAVRARLGIEQILADLETDSSSASARTIANKLVSYRAALRTIGSAPLPTDVVLSSSKPSGYALVATSDPAAVVVQGNVPAPFSFPSAAGLQVSNLSITLSYGFPQNSFDLNNQSHLISTAVAYPVTIPAGSGLYITVTKVDGSTVSYNIPLSGSMTLAAVLAAINGALGTDGGADEFALPGSSRILVYAKSPNTRISVDTLFLDPNGAGTGFPAVFNQSAHSLLGFSAGQGQASGSTPSGTIVDALSIMFGSAFVASLNSTGLLLTGADTGVAAYLNLSGVAASSLGIFGLFRPVSSSFRLHGSVLGSVTDPVDPRDLLEVGDLVVVSTGSATIENLTDVRVTLSSVLQSFDEAPVVDSAVVLAWQVLDANLDDVLPLWSNSGYQSDLTKLDRVIAPLNASSSPAQVNAAVAVLNDLTAQLLSMYTLLSAATTLLPDNAGQQERDIVNGIVASLEERKFDRAVDLLLRAKIQEALNVDQSTASFAGNFLKTASDLATNDLLILNRAKDEGLGPKGTA